MTLKLIIAPTEEPVSLTTAKLHLRVDHSADDALITTMIVAARQQAEHELQRALVTQTWERVLDSFLDSAGAEADIALGMPPVQSITSVKYIDPDGVEQTLGSTLYSLDADTEPGFVLRAEDTSWPATLDTANAVRVRFACGYGAAAAVPAAIVQWMLLQIGAMYRNREAFAQGVSVSELPGRFTCALLDPYRFYG